MITLDCYTYFPKVYEKHKLKQNAFPSWATENTKKVKEVANVYKNNIVVPIWTDMVLVVNKTGDILVDLTEDDKYKHELKNIVSNIDYNELMFSNVVLLELKSPWLIKADKDVMFHYNSLLWNHVKSVDKFWFLNQAFSFKKPTEINLKFMVTMRESRQDILEGTEIMQLIPLSKEKVKINHHLVTVQEYIDIENNK